MHFNRRKTASFVGIGLIVLVMLSAATRCAIHLVSHNYNLAAEANGLYGILDLADGRALYPPRTQKPYSVYLYPPFHAWLNAQVLTGLGITELRDRVLTVRILSLMALLSAIAIFWSALKVPARQRFIYWFALTLLLSKFADYATTARNDMLSLWFEVSALSAFLVWIDRQQVRYLVYWFLASYFAFFTRQTGIAVFGAGVTWLAVRGEWKNAVRLGFLFSALVAGLFIGLCAVTDGAFFEQVILANIRPFRPVDRDFFDFSLLSFIASYLLLLVFVTLGLRGIIARGDERDKFLALALGYTFSVASFLFLRAGGDVNYFFISLFIGQYFCARALANLGWHSFLVMPWRWGTAFALQSALIVFVCGYKSKSAYELAFLPYEKAADRVLHEIPPMGFLLGHYAQNMGIHLRGWAIHGPDVTNAGNIAENGHPQLRWLIKDLANSINQRSVSTIVLAEPRCQTKCGPLEEPIYRAYTEKECWYEWFCLYRPVRPTSHEVVLESSRK